MDTTPESDKMDWTPTGVVRTFDQMKDGSEPLSRDPGDINSRCGPITQIERSRVARFNVDSLAGDLRRLCSKVALCIWVTVYCGLQGAAQQNWAYITSGSKRRRVPAGRREILTAHYHGTKRQSKHLMRRSDPASPSYQRDHSPFSPRTLPMPGAYPLSPSLSTSSWSSPTSSPPHSPYPNLLSPWDVSPLAQKSERIAAQPEPIRFHLQPTTEVDMQKLEKLENPRFLPENSDISDPEHMGNLADNVVGESLDAPGSCSPAWSLPQQNVSDINMTDSISTYNKVTSANVDEDSLNVLGEDLSPSKPRPYHPLEDSALELAEDVDSVLEVPEEAMEYMPFTSFHDRKMAIINGYFEEQAKAKAQQSVSASENIESTDDEKVLENSAESKEAVDLRGGGLLDVPAPSNAESNDEIPGSVPPATSSPSRSALSPIENNRVSRPGSSVISSKRVPKGWVPRTSEIADGLRKYFRIQKRQSPRTSQTHTNARTTSTPIRKPGKTVGFYQSPKTGQPVNRLKRFYKGESIDYPSPSTSRDENSILSASAPNFDYITSSFTSDDQHALDAQLMVFNATPISESGLMSSALNFQEPDEVSFESTEGSSQMMSESGLISSALNFQGPGDVSFDSTEGSLEMTSESGLMSPTLNLQESGDVSFESTDISANNAMDSEVSEVMVEGTTEANGSLNGWESEPTYEGKGKQPEYRLSAEATTDGDSNSSEDDDGKKKSQGSEKDEEEEEEEDSKERGVGRKEDPLEEEKASREASEGTQVDQKEERLNTEDIIGKVVTTSLEHGEIQEPRSASKAKNKNISLALEDLSLDVEVSPRRVKTRRQTLVDKLAEEEAARKKAEQEERERREKEVAEALAREKEEKRKRLGGRRFTKQSPIQPLPQTWNGKLQATMAKGQKSTVARTCLSGTDISRYDVGRVFPQPNSVDPSSGWLNDAAITAYLEAVVKYGNDKNGGHKRDSTPKYHSFNNYFYNNLAKAGGYKNVQRWAKRAKIAGKDLLKVEYVFIPINVSESHWVLAVVSPARKTIEHFDSMHGRSSSIINNIRAWLEGELGSSYVEDEWTVMGDESGRYKDKGKGPTQDNMCDCGVFTITTAKMVMLNIEPESVQAEDMPLQRRRIVAELINGGFTDDLQPVIDFVD